MNDEPRKPYTLFYDSPEYRGPRYTPEAPLPDVDETTLGEEDDEADGLGDAEECGA